MGIVVEFKQPEGSILHLIDEVFDDGYSYLMECKQILDEYDYRDVLAGIMDKDIYLKLDEELQDIVNIYYMGID